MRTMTRRHRTTTGLLLAGLLGTAALTGCGAGSSTADTASADSAPGIVAVASESPVDVADLSAGLLPAEAFGAGATVTPLTEDTFRSGDAPHLPMGLGPEALAGLTVTPDACVQVLAQLRSDVMDGPGAAGITGAAAQLATAGTSRTVEVLASGKTVEDAVATVEQAVVDCPTATVTAPELGTATVTVTPIDAAEIGDGSVALDISVSATSASGATITVRGLAGMVEDGDRLVTLLSGDLLAQADRATFLDLLEQAYERQASELD